MSAKKVITREMILSAGLDLLRRENIAAVNTKNLTAALDCSTQPLYLAFRNMDVLREEVGKAAVAVWEKSLRDERAAGKYPAYKALGMGYILFAMREPGLFRYLFLERNGQNLDGILGDALHDAENTGVPADRVKDFHIHMWIYVHGVATLAATGLLPPDEELLSSLVTDQYNAWRKGGETA